MIAGVGWYVADMRRRALERLARVEGLLADQRYVSDVSARSVELHRLTADGLRAVVDDAGLADRELEKAVAYLRQSRRKNAAAAARSAWAFVERPLLDSSWHLRWAHPRDKRSSAEHVSSAFAAWVASGCPSCIDARVRALGVLEVARRAFEEYFRDRSPRNRAAAAAQIARLMPGRRWTASSVIERSGVGRDLAGVWLMLNPHRSTADRRLDLFDEGVRRVERRVVERKEGWDGPRALARALIEDLAALYLH